ncbi:MAG: hypothetical protein AB1597_04080 [Chloroflexota bacterium]
MFWSKKVVIMFASLSLILSILLLAACAAPAAAPASAPTPAPKPTPATAPAPTSTTAATGELKFEFVSVTPKVKKGGEIVVIGKTSPGAECTIVMTFANGQVSKLVFPEPMDKQVADADGKVEWRSVVPRVIIGTTKLDVTAVKDGKKATASTTYEIIES